MNALLLKVCTSRRCMLYDAEIEDVRSDQERRGHKVILNVTMVRSTVTRNRGSCSRPRLVEHSCDKLMLQKNLAV